MASEDSLNIDLVKTLDAGGNYIRLRGRSLFLTSNVDLKAQDAGKIAVSQTPTPRTSAAVVPASYYLYAADWPAKVLRFRPPVRKGAGK
jgi:hypothetical protein